ncbi:MAG: hypothetical protein IJI37_07860 [Opitutales bacterium]|nr:hypothetical protein [Opitutales bacterium]
MNKKLKPCPFCGKIPEIVITDAFGNIHNENYEQNPYNGLCYAIAHFDDDCPISLHPEDKGTVYYPTIYNTKTGAIAAWNLRAATQIRTLKWKHDPDGKMRTGAINANLKLVINANGDPPHYSFLVEIEGEEIGIEYGYLSLQDAKFAAQEWIEEFVRKFVK